MAGGDSPAQLPRKRIRGAVHRIIPSRFPVAEIYDSVASADEVGALMAVEALTNPRLASTYRQWESLAADERLVGPGSTPVMAAICNPNPDGTRFGSAEFGVYYAALAPETAILETVFHRERFLRTSIPPPLPHTSQMRRYECGIQVALPSLTRASHPQLLEPAIDSYPASQAFATALRAGGAYGLRYPSVRDPRGTCVAIFRPSAIQLPVKTAGHLHYQWDGARITVVSEIGDSYYVGP